MKLTHYAVTGVEQMVDREQDWYHVTLHTAGYAGFFTFTVVECYRRNKRFTSGVTHHVGQTHKPASLPVKPMGYEIDEAIAEFFNDKQ